MKKKKKPVSETCLLIKTIDNKLFFTHENNLPELIEYGRTFSSEISLVRAPTAPVLELEDLARTMTQGVQLDAPDYTVLEIKLAPNDSAPRQQQLEEANKAVEYAKTELLNGKILATSDLVSKFPKIRKKLIVNKTKRELADIGYEVVRIGNGQYRIEGKFHDKDHYWT